MRNFTVSTTLSETWGVGGSRTLLGPNIPTREGVGVGEIVGRWSVRDGVVGGGTVCEVSCNTSLVIL